MTRGFMAKCASGNRPKKRHLTQQEAERDRSRLVSAGIWTLAKSNTYHCNACGYWHAGSTGSSNRGAKGHRKGKKK